MILRTPSAVAAALLLTACGDRNEGKMDPATIDEGAFRTPLASTPAPPMASTTLPSGTAVYATPAAQEIQAYLASAEPPGKAFVLPSIGFVEGGQVREDPDGSIASLVAVLRAYPTARIRIETPHANPQQAQVSEASEDRARRVAEAFVRNGMPADRVTSTGVNAPVSQVPAVRLVVVQK
ncbi:hypothetical protein [Phenylobacterium sp.]|uniref:hypothetical protein n=1 Tax=Phenylobacterium sp. TaxID=1871053 RepID=UPI0035B10F00